MTSGTLTESKELPNARLGVVTRNVVPVRAEPDDSSEQTTQALMGQSVAVVEERDGWLRVQTWDTYEGWTESHAVRLAQTPYASSGTVAQVCGLWADLLDEPREDARIATKVTLGVELEADAFLGDWLRLRLPDGSAGYARAGSVRLTDREHRTAQPADMDQLTETALRLVGVPYLWGGTSTFGLDCSGFVQLVYHTQGITLSRDAWMQAEDPRCVPVEKNNLQPGDLLFFASNLPSGSDKITHVAVALDSRSFIHSCGSYGVVVTPLDDPGYSRIYLKARRVQISS